MSRRIPSDAFDYYASLGPGRSYQAVAAKYGVSKRAVTKHASRDGWQGRLEGIEQKARDRSDEHLVDVVAEMNERHLRTLKAIQAKAIQTLKSMPLASAMHAVRALDLAMKQERVIHGEPSDRSEVRVEDVIRKEYTRWMATADDEPEDDEAAPEP